jgi:DNA invertase Pin-like site-specific DNA recombinase
MLFFHLFGALAEFERELIRERTNAGLKAARARGRVGGRRKVLSAKKIEMGKALAADKSRRIQDICDVLKCSPATYYRYVHPQTE